MSTLSDNPKQFMIDQLIQLKKSKSTKKDYPCLFDAGNVEAVFRLMDPEGRGFISSAQFADGTWTIYCSFMMYSDISKPPTMTVAVNVSYNYNWLYCKTLNVCVPFISRISRAKQNRKTIGRKYQLQAKK